MQGDEGTSDCCVCCGCGAGCGCGSDTESCHCCQCEDPCPCAKLEAKITEKKEQTSFAATPANPKHAKIDVALSGLTCIACQTTVQNLLSSLDGVYNPRVTLKSAYIEVDECVISTQEIADEVDSIGFEVTGIKVSHAESYMTTVEFVGSNPEEARKVLLSVRGIEKIDVEDKRIRIHYNTHVSGVRDFMKVLEPCAFVLSPMHVFSDETHESQKWGRMLVFSLLFSIPAFMITMILMNFPEIHHFFAKKIHNQFNVLCATLFFLVAPVQFGTGSCFYSSAFHSLTRGVFNMSTLVSIGSTAAFVYSTMACIRNLFKEPMHGHHAGANNDDMNEHFFETSSTLITVIVFGKWLESKTRNHTFDAIRKLLGEQNPNATMVKLDENNQVVTREEIAVEQLHYGDCVFVHKGQKIPVDGDILSGKSEVDESCITGESKPVFKQSGDEVIGGSVNISQPIIVKVTKVGQQTMINQMVNLMKEAQTTKPQIQVVADEISQYFVPIVLVISLVSFVVWFSLVSAGAVPKSWRKDEPPFLFALLFSIAVLVIACPCALGLATPTAIMVGNGVALKYGILIKNGKCMEKATQVDAIVFDKTGTLTEGKPEIIEIHPESITKEDLLVLVASAESFSEHLLAKCIVEKSESLGLDLYQVQSFRAEAGKGVVAQVDGKEVVVGNEQFVKRFASDWEGFNLDISENSGTSLAVSIDGTYSGCILIEDTAREEARDVIRYLQSQEVSVYMLTGDNEKSARKVASEIGIPEQNVFAGVIPLQKFSKVRELQEAGKCVAMVGDGVNDAAALAQSDLSISMGSGTDIAMAAADIVLTNSNLESVVYARDLTSTVFTRIKLNFLWAFLFNVLCIPMAAGFFYPLIQVRIPPTLAAAVMASSSIFVVLSSLMLKRYKAPSLKTENSDLKATGGGKLEEIEFVHIKSDV